VEVSQVIELELEDEPQAPKMREKVPSRARVTTTGARCLKVSNRLLRTLGALSARVWVDVAAGGPVVSFGVIRVGLTMRLHALAVAARVFFDAVA
jgi:opacity protein-like surface antigen